MGELSGAVVWGCCGWGRAGGGGGWRVKWAAAGGLWAVAWSWVGCDGGGWAWGLVVLLAAGGVLLVRGELGAGGGLLVGGGVVGWGCC